MGYFDGFTANLFRHDATGRRVYAPFGKRGSVYVVPDEAAAHITLGFRRFYQVMLITIVGTQILAGWRWNVFLVGPLFILGAPTLSWWLVRSLERAAMSWEELPPIPPREFHQRQARAFGRPVLWAMLGITALFTALGVWMVATEAPQAWFVLGFFGLCTASLIVQLRRAR